MGACISETDTGRANEQKNMTFRQSRIDAEEDINRAIRQLLDDDEEEDDDCFKEEYVRQLYRRNVDRKMKGSCTNFKLISQSEYVKKFMKKVDKVTDGQITLEEFINFYKGR